MDIYKIAERFEKELHLPKDFFENLFFESKDDWTYIIRLHALVEAAVSNLITQRLKEAALQDVFSRLELGNEATGKVAFGKLLNVLDKRDLSYIKAISELRNLLVHNVEQVSFSLEEYYKSLDDNQFRSLAEKVLHGKEVVLEAGRHGCRVKRYFLEDSRHPWFIGACIVLQGIKMRLENEDDVSEKKLGSALKTFLGFLSDYKGR